MKLGEAMYQAAQADAEAEGEGGEEAEAKKEDDDVVDADFEEVKDEDDKKSA